MDLRILSLGAGVQSSTLALMAARGEIDPIDAAIFADTQAEPEHVYRWLDQLEVCVNECEFAYPIFRVTTGNLSEDSLKLKKSSRSGNTYLSAAIPAFLLAPEGTKSLLGRKCTADYKVKALQRKTKELLGIDRFKAADGVLCEQLIGISTDEAIRERKSRVPNIVLSYPLLELGMSRQDCLNWMEERGYSEPPKSACLFCPFHSDEMWLDIKQNDVEWQKIVQFERDLQSVADKATALRGKPFLHKTCVPINQVEFKPKLNKEKPQVDMFGNECEGLCGV
ncbi:MAG: hypothetical protein ACR2IJ_05795 [Fluviibacter sp.]